MNKFNAVQKNDMKQIIVEHMGPSASNRGPSASGAICNAASATPLANINNNSTCIPNANNWMTIPASNTQFTSFAVNAKCANGSIPALRREQNNNVPVNKYKCT